MSEKFGAYGEIISGYAFKSADLHDVDDIPVIKIGNIGNGGNVVFGNETQYVGKEFLDKIDEKFIVNNGDVLISLTGSHINQPNSMVGRSCRYLFDTPAFLNQRAGKVFPKENADGMYLYYLIHSNYFIQSIGVRAYGAANQANVSPKDIKKIKWNFPDLPTQTRIVDILSAYDDAIENNNRRIALLEKAAQELYKEWFVRFRFPGHESAKFVNGLPEGWEVKKVKEVLKRHPFGTLYKEPQLSPLGKTIVIDQSTKAYLGFHNNKPDHQASDESPRIIFGDHSCKMQLMIRPFSLSENVIPITSADETSEIFLYYSLLGKIETTEYKRHWSEFVAKKILLPTMVLRMSFTETVKDNISQKELLWEANQNLARQRDFLLPRLMSGKLEV